jgi:hypothetical protein
MKQGERLVREWWADVRYEDKAVRIRHPEWAEELVIHPAVEYRTSGEYPPQMITIHYQCNSKCGCERKSWSAAEMETRNTLFFIQEAMDEKDLLEEVLRDRKDKGIRELHDLTPIGRLMYRQDSIIYERGRFLKKSVTRQELKKVFGRGT